MSQPGPIGWRGQNMGGPKTTIFYRRYLRFDSALPASGPPLSSFVDGTVTLPPGYGSAAVAIWGPGGGGTGNNVQGAGAPSGGAALKFISFAPNQVIQYRLGTGGNYASAGMTATFVTSPAPTSDSSCILPDGSTMSATFGGQANVTLAAQVPGIGIGGDYNRRGGIGGLWTPLTNGSPGEFGGPGGISGNPGSGPYAGGGGTAGFSDVLVGEPQGIPSGSGQYDRATAGGGGMGGVNGVTMVGGGHGRILVLAFAT